MGLPLLLLVDDSEVVLAYEKSVLASHYALVTAVNGREALEKVEALRPAAILLDLSMPVMTGDEMLEKLLAHPELRSIPVIVISSEQERGEAAHKMGAATFLKKPIKADELRGTVARILEEAAQRRLEGNLQVILIEAGSAEVGVDLDQVETILLQPGVLPFSIGPAYIIGIVNVYGDPVCVLDLPLRLGLKHSVPFVDRKLVIVNRDEVRLAVCVDRVYDPLEVSREQVLPREQFAGTAHEPLTSTIRAVIQTSRGHRLVIDPAALLSRSLARKLAHIVWSEWSSLAPGAEGSGQ